MYVYNIYTCMNTYIDVELNRELNPTRLPFLAYPHPKVWGLALSSLPFLDESFVRY